MPVFRKRVIFSDLASTRFLEADAIIDTGSDFSQLPEEAATQLALVPVASRHFRLADGNIHERPWANLLVALSDTGDTAASIAVIAEPGTEVILGSHSLDALGMGVDTSGRRLIPKVFYLLAQTGWPTV